jgi:agmatine deiminase
MPFALRMPAEWEQQDAIWLAWPHNKTDWPDRFGPIPWAFVDAIRHLSVHTRVRLIVKNKVAHETAQDYLDRAGVAMKQIDFIIAPTNRIWLRDSGPTFVYRGKERVLLDWKFNAWAKYNNFQHDDKIPALVSKHLKLKSIQPMHKNRRVVLEGGAIDVNGKGTLLTTEECLLSEIQCRNPGFAREDYEAVFATYLGVSNVIWLGDGIVGDDTHGHVDDLARFVNANTVVIPYEKNKLDANYPQLHKNRQIMRRARDQGGRQLNVVELPMPRPIVFEGTRLPASYANFLISNKTVLVPTFNDVNDRTALNILSEVFPKHDVIGMHSGDFIWGFGAIHCASQQEITAI